MNDFFLYLPDYARALGVTLGISMSAAVVGAIAGFILQALCRHYLWLYWPWRTYVWIIRGTPYLAQLAVFYFGLPAIGVTLTAIEATVLSLAIYSSAYFGEIFRTAWKSIGQGQLEAAQVHDISAWKCFWHIQTPQALRFSLPLLGNQFILTIKESAVASIITVPELTMTTGQIVANTYTYIVPYTLLILSYWLLAQGISVSVRLLSRQAIEG
ncbi:amino acid ABC transporter permease [Yersinia enterocolitica]|jgi:polar amino acid transport system permease protein|uniref:ABC transporter inner-membrane component n=1 Tax=Yersinia intermedia TaxID=631 RepID=A0A0H5LTY5_YERIN|nr:MULTISPECIES: amino acid ABC transporter permease [Yersinia]HEI6965307.1 amino acid ABC transporter permease [Yersinia enterocolitica]ATM84745.1 amino acid ABC transporter permease [Yersinia frederiksenii]MCB5317538.1 amino acid ABC transporter permease [Yersinia massiliensis]CFR21721.1 ABC transporter inner-membrane component [Yersinia frederiksenii]CRY54372.1 ABC transporter inner-membrane component [Yersinia intermedia]